jgi:DNA-binding transcriptional LysR family regulator
LPGTLHVSNVQIYEAADVVGLGLIQAPLLAIGRYLESGALIELLPDFQHKPLDVSLVVAHRRNLSRRVRAFMKWIETVLAPYLASVPSAVPTRAIHRARQRGTILTLIGMGSTL